MKAMNEEKNFVGYEYQDVTVKNAYVNLYVDSYENFGWEFEDKKSATHNVGSTTLVFKRDRKIRNKAELTRLQRQFDSLVEQVDHLETKKVFKASAIAYILGVIGCGFMAASVMVMSFLSNTMLMIILAIPGVILWIIPYLVFRHIKNQSTLEVTPMIDEKYDEIYDVSMRANSLLSV
ncbi:hypothetical protein [Erysipelothrix larvae]|nr:hypothetical protein [Erysipelothrix larvae]